MSSINLYDLKTTRLPEGNYALREGFEQEFGRLMCISPDEFKWDAERNCYVEFHIHFAWKAWQLACNLY